ncbi:MAG: DUF2231 domain-containing protein [Flavisolibacter sp.]
MRSHANFKTHPLHPMLVPFPIAFFTGAFVFDVLALVLGNENLHQTAYHLDIAGIVGAVAAAVPGAIDYFTTVPPESSAKKRGAKHGIINSVNLLLFIAIAFYRNGDANIYVVTALELVGVVLVSIAGWMGGTLVYRNQIGVDIRYAEAGKWKEASLDDKAKEVALENELEVNQMKLVHHNGKRIVIGRTEEGFVAFEDRCTHRGGSLAGGAMMCGTVQCPWHGSQFDVNSGTVKAGPAKKPIDTYELEIRDGKVFLK